MSQQNAERHADSFAQLCLAFYASLRARKCPRLLAYMLTCAFLQTNLQVGAKLQLVEEMKEPFLFPAIRK